jgi:hypothetical protein
VAVWGLLDVVAFAAGLLDGVGVALDCVVESDFLLTGLFAVFFESE